MALPAIQVKLDDGTGTFPFDITAYVDMSTGFAITRGRQDEFSQAQPGTCSMTLSNQDGRFTPGATTYTLSAGGSAIVTDAQIRIVYTIGGGAAFNRYTGYVQSWGNVWTQYMSDVPITLVDASARLGRRPLVSMLGEEISLESYLVGYWPLDEPAGTTSAGNRAKSSAGALVASTWGSGGSVTFAGTSLTGLIGSPSAPSVVGSASGGGFLSGSVNDAPTNVGHASFASGRQGYTVECWVQGLTAPGSGVANNFLTLFPAGSGVAADTALAFGVNVAGQLVVTGGPGSGAITTTTIITGGLHHIVLAADTGNFFTNVYVDTVYVGGSNVTGQALAYLPVNYQVNVGSPNTAPGFTGAVAYVALYNQNLATTRITAHYNAGINGFNTDRSDQRIARIAGYVGVATTLDTGVQNNIAAQNLAGQSAQAAIQAVADAEGTALTYCDGSGNLNFRARSAYWRSVTANTVIGAADAEGGFAPTLDNLHLVNQATYDRPGGAKQVVANASSITKHGMYPDAKTLLVSDDVSTLQAANWKVAVAATPKTRVPNFAVDLLTETVAKQQALTGLDLLQVVQITGLPSQAPASSLYLFLEGFSEVVNLNAWTITFNTSTGFPQGFILNDATYGNLDSADVLTY